MAKSKDNFKTLYRAEFSSGGALQYNNVPNLIYTMMGFRVDIARNYELIEPLLDMVESLTEVYAMGFKNPERIYENIKKARELIKDWQMNHRHEKPVTLLNLTKDIYRDYWLQFNRCGGGIVFTPHDANRASKIYQSIIGN